MLSYSRKIFEDSFLQLWRQPWPISEHLRSKGAMETIRYMVLQLDPRQGPLPNILSVQDTELCHMFFGDIDLHDNVPVIFVSFSPWIVTEPRDEDRFAKTTVRIPYVTLSTFSVQLQKWKEILFNSEVTNKPVPTEKSGGRSHLPCPSIIIKSITLSFPLVQSIWRLFSNSAWWPLATNSCSTKHLENLSFYIAWNPWFPRFRALDSNFSKSTALNLFIKIMKKIRAQSPFLYECKRCILP